VVQYRITRIEYDEVGNTTRVITPRGVATADPDDFASRTDGFDHIAQSEQMNDAGVLESTTYKYDPLDRTASKTADGKTTDYTYLGLSSEVLGEEVAGHLTKSYQYSPWGQRLSQITHQADPEAGVEAGESAYYGYNSHTDVETITDDAGNAVATYGYTAYGDANESEYSGIDKPEAGSPEDAELYNAHRYNAKRWDAGSSSYDMGFRDYAPGLNRSTTRDMYNGALSDMSLCSDPYTGNRYAFGSGNPISMVEIDGHLALDMFGGDFVSDPWIDAAIYGGELISGTRDGAAGLGRDSNQIMYRESGSSGSGTSGAGNGNVRVPVGDERGSGNWIEYKRTGRGMDYQSQVAGVERGWESRIEVPGLSKPVDFDGWDGARKTLMDSKGGYGGDSWVKDGKVTELFAGKIRTEVDRQLETAGDTDLEWVFSDRTATSAVETFFEENGYDVAVRFQAKANSTGKGPRPV
jgi:RHS repeat-associated protein